MQNEDDFDNGSYPETVKNYTEEKARIIKDYLLRRVRVWRDQRWENYMSKRNNIIFMLILLLEKIHGKRSGEYLKLDKNTWVLVPKKSREGYQLANLMSPVKIVKMLKEDGYSWPKFCKRFKKGRRVQNFRGEVYFICKTPSYYHEEERIQIRPFAH